jgi:predicted membrane channel-forming protein YqfA (hemolysin III family)
MASFRIGTVGTFSIRICTSYFVKSDCACFFSLLDLHATAGHICSAVLLEDYFTFSVWAFLCGVVGCLIYATQVPERIYPGRFDIFFSSHQIWHILTALGPILSTFAGRALIQCQVATVGSSEETRSFAMGASDLG